MRVLQVIDKSFLGGGQTVVRHLIEGFRGSDVECALACRDGGPLADAVRALGAPVIPIPFDKRFRPGPARALARAARDLGADVVHTHGLVAATYGVLARSFFGMRVPLLYHQHGFHHHNYGVASRGLRRLTEKAICQRVDRVIAVSRADRDELLDGGYASAQATRLIYYGIPEPVASPAEVSQARRLAGVEPNQPVVGTIARLHRQKGVDVLLRAAARVRAQIPEAVFVVVGTGELEGELHALGRSIGLNGGVRWLGGRPAAPFLPVFDLSVLSSRWEGLPFTMLEAMAAGKAIVATDVPGCIDAAGDGAAAEIVPRENPTALADAISAVLRDPGRAARLGRSARERYSATFTLAKMLGSVEDLYVEVA